jgi:alpha-1,6-mannosyltransferase
MFFLSPIQATATHRYLWDGAVSAHGINPYAYSPAEVLENTIPGTDPNASILQRLAKESGGTIDNIHKPALRTIYPPAAQSLFCAAYWITPFKLLGWRVVLSIFDAIATASVGILLWRLGKSSAYLAVYFWNPLLIFETYYNCHLDLVAAALVITFAAFLLLRQHMIAGAALGLAVGIKIWPILLFPFLLFSCRRHWLRVLLGLTVFTGLMALWAYSYQTAVQNPEDSGVSGYLDAGGFNSGAYRIIDWVGWKVHGYFKIPLEGRVIGWLTVLFTLFLFANISSFYSIENPRAVLVCIGTLIAIMLLLSPVFHPWYYLALIPIAAAAPRWSFLLWTLLLPISYLPKEVINQRGWIVVIIHVPVWLLLIGSWMRQREKGPSRNQPKLEL